MNEKNRQRAGFFGGVKKWTPISRSQVKVNGCPLFRFATTTVEQRFHGKGDGSIFMVKNVVSARSGAVVEHNIYSLMLRYQTNTHLKGKPVMDLHNEFESSL